MGLLVAGACGTRAERGDSPPIDTAPSVVMDAGETIATLPGGWAGPPLVTADEPSLLAVGGSATSTGANALWALRGPFAGAVDPEASAVATLYDDADYASYCLSLQAGDIEGDPTPELAWLDDPPSDRHARISVARLDAASGAIVPYASIGQVAGGSGLALLPDYDGDGVGDLLVSDYTTLFQGPLSGTYERSDGLSLVRPYGGGALSDDAASVGDLDGDGYSDVLFLLGDYNWGSGVLFGSADPPRALDGLPLIFLNIDGEGPSPAVVGDLDGDGADDVALWFPVSALPADRSSTSEDDGLGTVLLYTGLHAGVRAVEDATARIAGARSVAYTGPWVAGMDIDGSGRSDLVVSYMREWGDSRGNWCAHCGLAVMLDPLAWGPDISILNADLLIEPSRPTDLWGPAFFENTGDGVPDIIAHNSNDWGDPQVLMYDGATLLATIDP